MTKPKKPVITTPPTSEQASGIFRTIIAGVGGYYVAKGKLDPAQVEMIAGTASVLGAGIWSYLAKRKA